MTLAWRGIAILSTDVKKVLAGELEEIGRSRSSLSAEKEANRALQRMEDYDLARPYDGENIELNRSPLLELAASDRFKTIYGLDSGSSRPQRFSNGLIFCINQAKAVVDGGKKLKIKGYPLEAYSTLLLLTYDEREELSAKREAKGLCELWRVHLSHGIFERRPERAISSFSRCGSEGRHALKTWDRLKGSSDRSEKGEIFFLDGGIYPIGLYYYLTEEGSWNWDVELESWGAGMEMLESFLQLVGRALQDNLPLIGVNKTPETRYLIRQLRRIDRYWHNDRQIISCALGSTTRKELGYTDWILQRRYPRRGVAERSSFNLFDELPFGLEGSREDYLVSYFFVYDPRVQSALKIETPFGILKRRDPEDFQRQILGEIARGKGVPNAIRRADGKARISREERRGLLRQVGLAPDFRYNVSRGEPL